MTKGKKHYKKRRHNGKYIRMKQEIKREEELEAEKLAMDLRNSVINSGLAVNKDIRNTLRDLDKDGEFGPQAGLELINKSEVSKTIENYYDKLYNHIEYDKVEDGYSVVTKDYNKYSELWNNKPPKVMYKDGKFIKNVEDGAIDEKIDSLIENLDDKLTDIDEKREENGKMVLETGEITEVVGGSQKPQEARRDVLKDSGVSHKVHGISSQKPRMSLSEVFWNVFITIMSVFIILAMIMLWMLFKFLFG